MVTAARNSWMVEQMDFPTAYLKAELSDDVYIRIPAYWNDYMSRYYCSGEIVKVVNAIYGLKQSGREWNHLLDKDLRRMGFQVCVMDACLYQAEDETTFIMVYVDDLFSTGPDKGKVMKAKDRLRELYHAKDIGKPDKL